MERYTPSVIHSGGGCKGCGYWLSDGGGIGSCFRYPPVIVQDRSYADALYPVTPEGCWCGEWQPAESRDG